MKKEDDGGHEKNEQGQTTIDRDVFLKMRVKNCNVAKTELKNAKPR
jgi:hypothetical protein